MSQAYEAFGLSKTLEQWAADGRCWVELPELEKRMKAGWPFEVAISVQKGQEQEKLTAFGETKTLLEWLLDTRCEVPARRVIFSLFQGKSLEAAMARPKPGRRPRGRAAKLVEVWGEKKSIPEWLADERCVVAKAAIYSRLYSRTRTWTLEEILTTPARGRGRQP